MKCRIDIDMTTKAFTDPCDRGESEFVATLLGIISSMKIPLIMEGKTELKDSNGVHIGTLDFYKD